LEKIHKIKNIEIFFERKTDGISWRISICESEGFRERESETLLESPREEIESL
jgi:hypothetical protein